MERHGNAIIVEVNSKDILKLIIKISSDSSLGDALSLDIKIIHYLY